MYVLKRMAATVVFLSLIGVTGALEAQEAVGNISEAAGEVVVTRADGVEVPGTVGT